MLALNFFISRVLINLILEPWEVALVKKENIKGICITYNSNLLLGRAKENQTILASVLYSIVRACLSDNIDRIIDDVKIAKQKEKENPTYKTLFDSIDLQMAEGDQIIMGKLLPDSELPHCKAVILENCGLMSQIVDCFIRISNKNKINDLLESS